MASVTRSTRLGRRIIFTASVACRVRERKRKKEIGIEREGEQVFAFERSFMGDVILFLCLMMAQRFNMPGVCPYVPFLLWQLYL